MSVEIKEKSKTPKFKIDDKVIIKCGERKGWHGIVLAITNYNEYEKYSIVFPCCNPHLAYFYPKEGLQLDDIVGEITKIFKDMHLTPISSKHREYMTGYIDCAYEYAEMTPEQRDELYKKMGIE